MASTGPADSGAPTGFVSLRAISADGTRALFTTTQSLVSADTDSRADLYERHGGVTTLVSIGDVGGNRDYDVCRACRFVTTCGCHSCTR